MVTIIVPVYNIIAHLPHCVESLMAQEWDALEIILVDDGSTDGSGLLCDRYADLDPRIQVIHKCNGGLSSARNAGLDAARGQWILFVDGDDYLTNGAVAQLLELAAQHPDADFIQFHYHETTDTRWQPDAAQQANPVICADAREFFDRLYRLGGVAASACTKLFRRDSIGPLRFLPGIRHEDEEFHTRYLPVCRKAVYTDLTLYGYVMRQGSIVHSAFSPKAMDIFPIMDGRIRVLQHLDCADLVVETKRRMFQTAAWQYCLARKGGFTKEVARLKEILLSLSKEPLPLSGQYKLLWRLSRITGRAPEIYYQIRRICGKS